MRTRHHSWKDRILAILERVAELWAQAFLYFVALPALDPKRLQTKEDVDALERHLFLSEAHLARAIYRTARRLAGLPRIPCPIEAFYLPPLKTARHIRWRYLHHSYNLQHARRLAIRVVWRWKRETERKQRDPLCDLRGSANEATGVCLPLSRSDWRGRRIASTIGAQRQDGGGSPAGILGARAPPWRPTAYCPLPASALRAPETANLRPNRANPCKRPGRMDFPPRFCSIRPT
jgi:hypothetical protein